MRVRLRSICGGTCGNREGGSRNRGAGLTDRAAAAAWIARIEQTTGGAVDVLVNNAGGVAGQEMRPIEEVPDADWDRIFAVNIGAAFTLSRAVAAGMKRAGSGRIINISSGAGLGPSLTGIQAYCSAKQRSCRLDPSVGARARAIRHYRQQRRAGLRPLQRGIRKAVGWVRRGRAKGSG